MIHLGKMKRPWTIPKGAPLHHCRFGVLVSLGTKPGAYDINRRFEIAAWINAQDMWPLVIQAKNELPVLPQVRCSVSINIELNHPAARNSLDNAGLWTWSCVVHHDALPSTTTKHTCGR